MPEIKEAHLFEIRRLMETNQNEENGLHEGILDWLTDFLKNRAFTSSGLLEP